MKIKIEKFIVVSFFLFLFVVLFGPNFSKAIVCPPSFVENAGICLPEASEVGLTEKDAGDLFADVVSWAMYLMGGLSIIFIVYSGTQYVLSAGDEKKTDAAKETLKYSIIGFVVALTSLIIVNTVMQIAGEGCLIFC